MSDKVEEIDTEVEPEECCTENSYTCGPPPKRPRRHKLNILDVIEVDLCRRAILNYVPLKDLLKSELVCHRWRNAVHHYLRVGRRMHFKLFITAPWHPRRPPRPPRGRALPLDERRDPWFGSTLYKWGMAVEAAPCTKDSFEEIVENCPNLQEITVYGVPDRDLLRASVDKLRHLKRISFRNLCSETGETEQVTDSDVSIFLQNNSIEELAIIGNDQVTGLFFQDLKTNLTRLYLRDCSKLNYIHLLSVLEYFTDVTKLDLSRNPDDVLKNVHLILDVMPKLDHLELCGYDKIDLDGNLKAHPRFEKLSHLSLRGNANVNDDWLKTIAKGNGLSYFDVSYCKGVTMTGLTEVCQTSRSMSELSVADNHDITDEDVETLIRLCPNLMVLNIQDCLGVTAELVAYLARLMRRRSRWRCPALRLRLRGTAVPAAMPMKCCFILDFNKAVQIPAKVSPYAGFCAISQ